jgi:hypothetical protein
MKVFEILQEYAATQKTLSPFLQDLIRNDWRHHDQAEDYLRDSGFKHLGEGAYSTVYGKGKYVVKVSTNHPDRSWDKYIRFIVKAGESGGFAQRHLPKIFGYNEAIKKHKDVQITVSERLMPVHTKEFLNKLNTENFSIIMLLMCQNNMAETFSSIMKGLMKNRKFIPMMMELCDSIGILDSDELEDWIEQHTAESEFIDIDDEEPVHQQLLQLLKQSIASEETGELLDKFISEVVSKHIFTSSSKTIQGVIRILEQLQPLTGKKQGKETFFDMHEGNIMVRLGTNDIVFTDPLAEDYGF